jgi:hypothetical protein
VECRGGAGAALLCAMLSSRPTASCARCGRSSYRSPAMHVGGSRCLSSFFTFSFCSLDPVGTGGAAAGGRAPPPSSPASPDELPPVESGGAEASPATGVDAGCNQREWRRRRPGEMRPPSATLLAPAGAINDDAAGPASPGAWRHEPRRTSLFLGRGRGRQW